jgi:hypothetical protein
MKPLQLLFVLFVGLTLLAPQAYAAKKGQKLEDLKFYQGLLERLRGCEGKLAALRAAEGKLDEAQRPTEKQRKALEKEIKAVIKEVKTEMSNEDNKERLTKAQVSGLKEDMEKIQGFFEGESIAIGKGPQMVDQSQGKIGMGSTAATTQSQARTSDTAPKADTPQFGAAAEEKEKASEKKEKDAKK